MDKENAFLINELRLGNKAAFEFVFKKYYSSLCLYAKKYLKEDASAEDVVSNFFFQLYKNRSTFNIHTSLKAYVFQSVRNQSLNYLRDNFVRIEHFDEKDNFIDELFILDETVHETLLGAEVDEQIAKILEQLPNQCRLIFEMSRFKGMKYKEIADELDLSVNTVETQISRALKKLRIGLRDYLHLFYFLNL